MGTKVAGSEGKKKENTWNLLHFSLSFRNFEASLTSNNIVLSNIVDIVAAAAVAVFVSLQKRASSWVTVTFKVPTGFGKNKK